MPTNSSADTERSSRSDSKTRAAKKRHIEKEVKSRTSMDIDNEHVDDSLIPIAKNVRFSESLTVSTLENALTTVQAGVEVMKDIVDEYKSLYDSASLDEKKAAFNKLIDSAMYVNFTRAAAESAAALNNCSKFLGSNPTNTQQKIQNDISVSPTCAFEVRIVPIEGKVPPNTKVMDIFLAATENIRLNVTSSEDKNGTGYIRVTTMEHATNAAHAIEKFLFNGTQVSEMYTITASAISSNTIRTIKAKLSALLNITWIKADRSIDINIARNIMLMKNCDWCVTASDIEHIQLNQLPDNYCVIQLFLSSAAFDRIVIKGRSSLRINVGNGITMQAYINVNPITCFKCLAFGHVMSSCNKPPKCKHCGLQHPSASCANARNPTCFRCEIANTHRTHEDQICANHHALHRNCPEMEHQCDLALIARQQEALKRFNVNKQ